MHAGVSASKVEMDRTWWVGLSLRQRAAQICARATSEDVIVTEWQVGRWNLVKVGGRPHKLRRRRTDVLGRA